MNVIISGRPPRSPRFELFDVSESEEVVRQDFERLNGRELTAIAGDIAIRFSDIGSADLFYDSLQARGIRIDDMRYVGMSREEPSSLAGVPVIESQPAHVSGLNQRSK